MQRKRELIVVDDEPTKNDDGDEADLEEAFF